MKLVAAALLVCLAAGTAIAQPSATPAHEPAPSGRVVGEVSEDTALVLSLGGTLASYGAAVAASKVDSGGLGTVAALGITFAPSFGHWYSGKFLTRGLGLRLAGMGGAFMGAVISLSECPLFSDSGCEESNLGPALMIGGAIAFVAGTVDDIATAPAAARRHNQRAREGFAMTVAPTYSGDRVGLAVAGRF